MNNHGDYAKVGDLVRVYDLRGMPTKIVGVVHDIWIRQNITDICNVKYIKITLTADDYCNDWTLASTVRILSKVK
jgi:hypothetical protein